MCPHVLYSLSPLFAAPAVPLLEESSFSSLPPSPLHSSSQFVPQWIAEPRATGDWAQAAAPAALQLGHRPRAAGNAAPSPRRPQVLVRHRDGPTEIESQSVRQSEAHSVRQCEAERQAACIRLESHYETDREAHSQAHSMRQSERQSESRTV